MELTTDLREVNNEVEEGYEGSHVASEKEEMRFFWKRLVLASEMIIKAKIPN